MTPPPPDPGAKKLSNMYYFIEQNIQESPYHLFCLFCVQVKKKKKKDTYMMI